MDLSESISFQMDTTSDSMEPSSSPMGRNQHAGQQMGSQDYGIRLNHDDELTRLPPDKLIVVDETPPSSSSSSSAASQAASSPESSPILSVTSPNQSSAIIKSEDKCCMPKKTVLFDKVTIYHFKRSQGFTSIPSQGGSTLGMKRRHFLRRRMSVDLYEEVRRRSRREILLKIKFEKKRQAEQQLCDERLHSSSNSSSASNTNTSDSDDESYSDISDISDSELDNDNVIFLQPMSVKLRRSLLRASGVGRIDPKEKKECKLIRDSRDRSGCKCVGQCIPEYCECIRLGVNCHVDRVSFPCGCNSSGCQNPNGRTEFDIARVRGHFVEKVFKSPSSCNDNGLTISQTTTIETSPTLDDSLD